MSLLTSLAAFFKLDETSGSATDAQGSSTLADTGGVGTAAGKINTARAFVAASSQKLTCADNAALSTGNIDFTWAGWLYSSFDGGTQDIIYKGSGSAAEYRIHKLNYSATFTVWSASGFANETLVSSSTTILQNTWYFLVCWHDSVNNVIGISINNETPVTTPYTFGVYDGTTAFNMGAEDTFRYWGGRLDEWGLWKRVLTSTERSDLYNGGAGLPFSSFGGAAAADFALAATLAPVTLASSFTAAAPATSSFAFTSTLAPVTLASSFTAAAVGTSAFALAGTLAPVGLSSSFAAAVPATSSFAISTGLAPVVLTSTFATAGVGVSTFALAGTLAPVALSSSFTATAVGATTFALAGTVPVALVSSFATAAAPMPVGHHALPMFAGFAWCHAPWAGYPLGAAEPLEFVGLDPYRGTMVLTGPDPGMGTMIGAGPDPRLATMTLTGPDPQLATMTRA